MIEVFTAINAFWAACWPSSLGIIAVLAALFIGFGIGYFGGYIHGYKDGFIRGRGPRQ